MSQRTAKFIPLSDPGKYGGAVFTGGIIDNSEPWMIGYKNTPYARNFRVGGRGISSRLGFSQFGESLGASDYPRGIAAYYRSVLANDRIILRYNVDATHKLVSVHPTTGAQTSVDTGALITSDNRMQFLSANDSLYCFNGVDLIGKLNGTTYTNPTATLKPSFGSFFKESAWVSGDAQSPNTIYKSETNNPESFSGAGNDVLTFPYPITGLCSTAQTLYVFAEGSIDMINDASVKTVGTTLVYTSIPLEAMEGAIGHSTIASVGRDVYFLSRSGKIKKVQPNMLHYDVQELSHRANRGINKTMYGLDADQSGGFCYVVPELQIIKWHLKTKGSIFNDICIVYNTEYDEFMVDDHKTFYGGVNYKSKNFTISQIEPKIYNDEYGYTDDDSTIQFRYDTKIMNFGENTIDKCLWQLRTFLGINRIGKVYQNIYADGSLIDSKLIEATAIPSIIPQVVGGIGTQCIGTFEIGTEGYVEDAIYNVSIVRDKGFLRVRAKTFQISYISYDAGSRVLLQSTEPQIESLPFLTTDSQVPSSSISYNLGALQNSLGENVQDTNGEQIYSKLQVTV